MGSNRRGKTIKALRGLRDLSAGELGAMAGCARMTITRIESGQSDPSVGLLVRILDALGADEQVRLGLLK